MISADHIRRIAREEKLAVGVIEKDYALSWLLRGFYRMNSGLDDGFVLKGGTAIRKVYFPQTWRARMSVSKFLCEVVSDFVFASSVDGVVSQIR